MGLGWVDSLEQIRQVVVDSFEPIHYGPAAAESDAWDEAYARFSSL